MLFRQLYFNVQLDITNACNLRCTHCYHSHHLNDGALSFANWHEVIAKIQKFAAKTGMRPKLVLCGGEPITSPYLVPLVEHWTKVFPNGSKAILTNGTLLRKPLPLAATSSLTIDYAQWLTENGFHFQISVDGPDEESHDKIRGLGNFRKTISGIRRLVELNAKFNVLAVLTKEAGSRIADFFELASKEKIPQMSFERMIPIGSAEGKEKEYGLSKIELRNAYVEILKQSKAHGINTSTKGALWADIDSNLGTADTLGFYDWIVSYKGDLKVSSRSDFSIGHVLRDDPIKVLSTHPLLKALRHGKIEGCSSCNLFRKGKCSGNRNAAFAETRNFLAQDPDCWRLDSDINRNLHGVENVAV